MPNDADCGNSKNRVDAHAKDALKEIGKMEREHLPKELKADLEKVEKDLNAILMDNHKAQ